MKEILRRGLRAVVLLVLRLRSRPYQPAIGSRSLIIAPHQDDEALGCAGLIMARRAAGLPVSIVYLTDGAASHPGHPHLSPAELARVRRTEAIAAMQLLQVEAGSLQFLEATDGSLARLTASALEELAGRLAAAIMAVQPTELLLPCRDDGSSEHVAAFLLAQRALQLTSLQPRLLEYPVWARWSSQRLIPSWGSSRHVWRLAVASAAPKRAALACYRSQVESTPPWPDPVLPRGFINCFESPEEFFLER